MNKILLPLIAVVVVVAIAAGGYFFISQEQIDKLSQYLPESIASLVSTDSSQKKELTVKKQEPQAQDIFSQNEDRRTDGRGDAQVMADTFAEEKKQVIVKQNSPTSVSQMTINRRQANEVNAQNTIRVDRLSREKQIESQQFAPIVRRSDQQPNKVEMQVQAQDNVRMNAALEDTRKTIDGQKSQPIIKIDTNRSSVKSLNVNTPEISIDMKGGSERLEQLKANTENTKNKTANVVNKKVIPPKKVNIAKQDAGKKVKKDSPEVVSLKKKLAGVKKTLSNIDTENRKLKEHFQKILRKNRDLAIELKKINDEIDMAN